MKHFGTTIKETIDALKKDPDIEDVNVTIEEKEYSISGFVSFILGLLVGSIITLVVIYADQIDKWI